MRLTVDRPILCWGTLFITLNIEALHVHVVWTSGVKFDQQHLGTLRVSRATRIVGVRVHHVVARGPINSKLAVKLDGPGFMETVCLLVEGLYVCHIYFCASL